MDIKNASLSDQRGIFVSNRFILLVYFHRLITITAIDYLAFSATLAGSLYAAVPHRGTVERLCLKLPDVSLVE